MRRSHRSSGLTVLAVIGIGVLQHAGCRAPEPITVPEAPSQRGVRHVTVQAIEPVVRAQALRMERLAHLHRLGTASLTWTDDEGEAHREPQLELTLFHRRPYDTAAEFRKFGVGTIIWLGADAEGWWVFDLRPGMPRTLLGDVHRKAAGGESPAGAMIPPAAIAALFGLVALPEEPSQWRQLANGDLVARLEDAESRTLVYLDGTTQMPRRVEVAPRGARHRLIATLAEDRYIDVAGVAPFDRPFFPHRILIVRDDEAFRLDVRLDAPESTPPDSRWSRLFDVTGLMERFRPEIIEGPWGS